MTGYETATNNQISFDGTYLYAYDGEGNRVARVTRRHETEQGTSTTIAIGLPR